MLGLISNCGNAIPIVVGYPKPVNTEGADDASIRAVVRCPHCSEIHSHEWGTGFRKAPCQERTGDHGYLILCSQLPTTPLPPWRSDDPREFEALANAIEDGYARHGPPALDGIVESFVHLFNLFEMEQAIRFIGGVVELQYRRRNDR